MRLVLFLSVDMSLVVIVELLGRYGTVHPCGLLSHTLRMQLICAPLTMPESGVKEERDAKLTTQQALPMIARFIKAKSSWTCTKDISRVCVGRGGVSASSQFSRDIP